MKEAKSKELKVETRRGDIILYDEKWSPAHHPGKLNPIKIIVSGRSWP